MGGRRLIWTGERLQFDGLTGNGELIRIGGDAEGPGECAVDLAESKYYSVAATLRPVIELSHSYQIVAS